VLVETVFGSSVIHDQNRKTGQTRTEEQRKGTTVEAYHGCTSSVIDSFQTSFVSGCARTNDGLRGHVTALGGEQDDDNREAREEEVKPS
jgi:hypothetical protein